MSAYVLIVNWNGWADTIECLESVFQLDYPDFRVVVCDNGSGDGSLQRIALWASGKTDAAHSLSSPLGLPENRPVKFPISCKVYDRHAAEAGGQYEDITHRLVLIDIRENLGFAGGNNVGLKYILQRGDAEYVWLLNNDTVVEAHALAELVSRMNAKPDAGMCGSTVLYYDSPEKIQAAGGGWHCKWIGLPWHYGRFSKLSGVSEQKAEAWMNYVEGASMLVSRAFLDDVGLMCEDYFLYFEESDWALRATGRYTLAYAKRSIVYHKVGKSIGTSSDPRKKSSICDYYAIKNRILFTKTFFPKCLPVIYLSLCITIIMRLCFGQMDRVRMILSLMRNCKTLPPPAF